MSLNQTNMLIFLFYKISSSYFMAIVFMSLVCLGILGNLINVIVFSMKKLRKSFSFVLISRLSLIDMIILAVSLFDMLFETNFNTDIRTASKLFCKMDTFLAYFLLHARNIIFMTISIESKYSFKV